MSFKKGSNRKSELEDYDGFVEKFKPKKTTDDCYTPPAVYDAVLGWLGEQVSLDGRAIVRPFYPGGDYESYDYPDGCVVVDNPPFSIVSKIRKFYAARGIDYFLFAPGLTLMSSPASDENRVTFIITGETVVYENGAKVQTGFISNLFGDLQIWCCSDLSKRIKAACAASEKDIARYSYPPAVVTAALLNKIAKRVDFKVGRADCTFIRKLDSQQGKVLFGGGFLLSERAAVERAAAERAAAERAVVERAAAERAAAERAAKVEVTHWELSERERALQRGLGDRMGSFE